MSWLKGPEYQRRKKLLYEGKLTGPEKQRTIREQARRKAVGKKR